MSIDVTDLAQTLLEIPANDTRVVAGVPVHRRLMCGKIPNGWYKTDTFIVVGERQGPETGRSAVGMARHLHEYAEDVLQPGWMEAYGG